MSTGASRSPRLTIVIPTVNRASLVGRAIDSALAQTYSDLEIIASNNDSTHGTRAMIERYEGAPRTRILHREETIPASSHGNLLIQQAEEDPSPWVRVVASVLAPRGPLRGRTRESGAKSEDGRSWCRETAGGLQFS